MKPLRLFFCFVLAFLCGQQVGAQRLVMPGDYPDPSVVKIGDTYWASATTSNWMPAYPILKSKDLIQWETVSHVFDQKPDWVDYYFWAPEISYENGKVYIYYSAHKKDGNLCVGVASADRPEGPYRDHGPLICQPVGSIDAFPMRDEEGRLYMIWKEDANSVNQPTPIWIQEMNEERTALVGEKKELFRNDVPWEANLVEGVAIMPHGDYLYAFYAAAGCCGSACTYGVGIARAKKLLGPWEKYEKNPVMTGSEDWKCPGHGTPVEKDGRYYLLHHAYSARGTVYTGREGILSEFKFTPDGWIEFVKEDPPATIAPQAVSDDFKGKTVSDRWQWSVFQDIDAKQRRGRLQLKALPGATGAFLGQKTYDIDYTAETGVLTRKSDAAAGIGAIGDEKNTINALVDGDSLKLVQVKDGKETVVTTKQVERSKKLYLRMQVRNGKNFLFFYSTNGQDFEALNTEPLDGGYLPPWDRAIRAGLIAKGEVDEKAVFDFFEMKSL